MRGPSLLLVAVASAHWIDPDTPKSRMSTTSLSSGEKFRLVFSDEFEEEGRNFADGSDPRWTALEKNDYTNAALQYYKAHLAATTNGVLNLTTQVADTYFRSYDEDARGWTTEKKTYQSAMVQGWNKFCFTGGIVEISAQLPGDAYTSGLWPALWLLGNLARATYVASSDFMWPWSFNKCPMQESPTLSVQQELSACKANPHYGLRAHQGRGAPEIDILEAMPGFEKLERTSINKPYLSSSLQVSPGLEDPRPVLGFPPPEGQWYEGMKYHANTSLNIFFYGVKLEHDPPEYSYQSDAISANTNISKTLFESQHIYRVEWEPPTPDYRGHISWFIDGVPSFTIHGENLDLTGAKIPAEPMYVLLNTAVSKTWGFPAPTPSGCKKCFDCRDIKCACACPPGMCDNLPAHFLVDYVRVYQRPPSNDTEEELGSIYSPHTVGCSTRTHPTKRFIEAHLERYCDPQSQQRVPLREIEKGGASCTDDRNCGHGYCSAEGKTSVCVCEAGFVGPRCRSHDGFNIENEPEDVLHLHPRHLYIPPALTFFAALIALIFVFTTAYAAHRRRAGYTRVR